MTRVITVANQKGGVGKTTSTVNIAAAIAQAGHSVVVIDMDPQGNASTALGATHHEGTPIARIARVADEREDDVEARGVGQEIPTRGDVAAGEIARRVERDIIEQKCGEQQQHGLEHAAAKARIVPRRNPCPAITHRQAHALAPPP
jgi:chromosome partitioning protein